MKFNYNPSELPFSLDLIERCLLGIGISYFISTILSYVGIEFFTTFFLFSTIASVAVFGIDRMKVNPRGKAVLVTGCDTGFGNAIVRRLHQMGYTIYAGCYSKETDGAKALIKDFKTRMFVLEMDVTSEESVQKAVEFVNTNEPAGVWAVITNAGWSTFGLIEWVPMNIYEKIMSINLFGTVRTVKAALPLIRRGKGRVITVSSMMGRFGAVSRSPYCCTKWGVEGFTECLRPEMKPWNVDVICIEPGNFVAGTALYTGQNTVKKQGEHLWNNLSQQVRDDYGKKNFDEFVAKMEYYSTHGETNIEPVLKAMTEAVGHTYPQSRYQIFSTGEKIRCFVSTHFPSMVYDYFYN